MKKEASASVDEDARRGTNCGDWIQGTEMKRLNWWSLLVLNVVSKA